MNNKGFLGVLIAIIVIVALLGGGLLLFSGGDQETGGNDSQETGAGQVGVVPESPQTSQTVNLSCGKGETNVPKVLYSWNWSDVAIDACDAKKAKETFFGGQIITGLKGKNSLEGQDVSVEVRAIVASGLSPITYTARFVLWDDNGTEIGTYEASSGDKLNEKFKGSDNLDALETVLTVESIGVGAASGEGEVEIRRENEDFVYCDATQFTIALNKKINSYFNGNLPREELVDGFEVYLMKERYNSSFQEDFDTWALEKNFLDTPSWYKEEADGLHKLFKKINYNTNLSTPGRFSVKLENLPFSISELNIGEGVPVICEEGTGGCRNWVEQTACRTGETCQAGLCVAEVNNCDGLPENTIRCSPSPPSLGGTIEKCVLNNQSGELEWNAQTICPELCALNNASNVAECQTVTEGTCVDAPLDSVKCATVGENEEVQKCVYSNGKKDWQTEQICTTPTAGCATGQCIADSAATKENSTTKTGELFLQGTQASLIVEVKVDLAGVEYPVEDANVEISVGGTTIASLLTTQDGFTQSVSVDQGDVNLNVTKDGYEDLVHQFTISDTTSSLTEAVKLIPTSTNSFFVSATANSQPLEGATVNVIGNGITISGQTTLQNNVARTPSWTAPEGDYTIIVLKDGFDTNSQDVTLDQNNQEFPFSLESSTTTLNVRVSKGGPNAVTGGTLVEGASVTVQTPNGPLGPTMTNAQGVASFSDVNVGQDVNITMTKNGYHDTVVQFSVSLIDSGSQTVETFLTPDGTISPATCGSCASSDVGAKSCFTQSDIKIIFRNESTEGINNPFYYLPLELPLSGEGFSRSGYGVDFEVEQGDSLKLSETQTINTSLNADGKFKTTFVFEENPHNAISTDNILTINVDGDNRDVKFSPTISTPVLMEIDTTKIASLDSLKDFTLFYTIRTPQGAFEAPTNTDYWMPVQGCFEPGGERPRRIANPVPGADNAGMFSMNFNLGLDAPQSKNAVNRAKASVEHSTIALKNFFYLPATAQTTVLSFEKIEHENQTITDGVKFRKATANGQAVGKETILDGVPGMELNNPADFVKTFKDAFKLIENKTACLKLKKDNDTGQLNARIRWDFKEAEKAIESSVQEIQNICFTETSLDCANAPLNCEDFVGTTKCSEDKTDIMECVFDADSSCYLWTPSGTCTASEVCVQTTEPVCAASS